MCRRWIINAGILLFLVSPKIGAAQDGSTGRVVGRILDGDTGRGLSGAQIVVEGSHIGTLAGVNGHFTLLRVPTGTRTLVVSFLGYGTKSVEGVQITDEATSLDISLTPSAIAMEGIVVSAERERGTVNRALNEQRTAVNVVNAISAEQISRSGDGDAAAAIQRVSGVTVQDGKFVVVRGMGERYTTTALNGARIPSPEPERKVVPLDLFPSGLLQTITTSKTFTPDLPGDFAGAAVNIQTREFPSRRRMAFSLSTGYNDAIAGRSIASAPLAGGERFAMVNRERGLPAPVQAAGDLRGVSSQQHVNQLVGSFRNAWSVRPERGTPNLSASASVGGTDAVFGQDIGYLLSGTYSYAQEIRSSDYRATYNDTDHIAENIFQSLRDSGRMSVLWGGLLNLNTHLGPTTRLFSNNVYNRTGESEARIERGFLEDDFIEVEIDRLRYVERTVRSNQVGGEHQFGAHNLTWKLTSSGVTREEPDRSEVVHVIRRDPEGGLLAREWLGGGTEAAVRTYGDLSESNLEAGTDYRFTFGRSQQHAFKLGGVYRSTSRDAANRAYSITNRGRALTAEEKQLGPESIFDGRFSQPDDMIFAITPLLQGGSYAATDRLAAAYLMGEFQLTDRLQLVGGARAEQSDVAVAAVSQDGSMAQADPTYTDVLPSLLLNIDLTDQQKLRLSASSTIARPEYRELVPYLIRDVLGGENVQGFPGLRRTRIQNYDVRWEWYPNPDEVLSIGAFAKRFKDPIERVYLGTSGTLVIGYRNPEGATNYGAEFELRKNLGSLGALFEPFSLSVNATLMRSRIEVGDSLRINDNRPLVGQAPYVINIGLTYAPETSRASATLLYNTVGERVYTVGAIGLPDVMEQPRKVLDLSFRYAISEGLSVKLDGKNLLDTPFEVRQGEVVRESYGTGRVFSAGITWQP